MKYNMFSKTRKVIPGFKWLSVFMPSTVIDWFTVTDKSAVAVMNETQQYADSQRHPAESRVTRKNDLTPRP